MGIISAIVAGIGAITGLFSAKSEYDQAMEQGRDRIAEYERQKAQKLKDMDLQFDIANQEAKKKADRQDKALTLDEMFTSESLNGQFDALRIGQEENALAYNMQAMKNDQQTGEELSAMAASGTRSSSMADAVDMEASLNSQALQLQEDRTRAQDKIQLANLFGNLGQARNNISLGREDAMDLRTTYDEGGNQWKLYQNDRENVNNDFNAAINSVQNDMQRASDNRWKNYLTSMFGGATTGYRVGATADDFIKNWKPNINHNPNPSNWTFKNNAPKSWNQL